MDVLNKKIAAKLGGKLDDKPNACVMLSAVKLTFLDGKMAVIGIHCDSLHTSIYNKKRCKRVKIMFYGGGADMKRDFVFTFKGKIIGGVEVQAGDIIISSDAFLEGNQMGHNKERTDIRDLGHCGRLRGGGGGPSVLFTFYLQLPDATDVVKLLSELAQELPPATCIPATPATLRALEEVDYPESKRIIGGYSRSFGFTRVALLQRFDRTLITYDLMCRVMKPYLEAPDYRKDLLNPTATKDSKDVANLGVRACMPAVGQASQLTNTLFSH